jgi:hypothetical protein
MPALLERFHRPAAARTLDGLDIQDMPLTRGRGGIGPWSRTLPSWTGARQPAARTAGRQPRALAQVVAEAGLGSVLGALPEGWTPRGRSRHPVTWRSAPAHRNRPRSAGRAAPALARRGDLTARRAHRSRTARRPRSASGASDRIIVVHRLATVVGADQIIDRGGTEPPSRCFGHN